MGVFIPNKKTGEVLGEYAFRPYTKKQKQDFAIQKEAERERKIAESYYARKRLSKKFNDTVKEQLARLKRSVDNGTARKAKTSDDR